MDESTVADDARQERKAKEKGVPEGDLIYRSVRQDGDYALQQTSAELMWSVYAGFLIAVMVWLLPGSGAARLWIVVLLTYLVGLGGFSHVIAGSSECFYLIFKGERTFLDYLTGYFVPALIGNAVGGVMFVAALAHAQHAPTP